MCRRDRRRTCAARAGATAQRLTRGRRAHQGRAALRSAKNAVGRSDLQGTYTNKDENGIPMERPGQFAGKNADDVDDSEFAEIVRERQERALASAAGIGGADTGAGPVHWYEHYNAKNSRAWLIIDPADGRIPALTAAGQKAADARAVARKTSGRGPADSWEDRSLYDRCITRGVPGSMMPAIYGNAYDITQGPGVVAIRYEMIHETRIIPIDDSPRPAKNITSYMGSARARWEGSTLVIETRNFNERGAFRNANPETLHAHRTVHASRAEQGALGRDDRRQGDLDQAVDLRDEPDEFIDSGSVAVSGTWLVGSVLRAEVSGWNRETVFSYQWQRDGVDIAGATETAYRITTGDRGKQLRVEVTARLDGYDDAVERSKAILVPATLTAPTPTISGTARVDGKLTAVTGAWTAGTTLSYQWYVGGAKVSGATSSSFKPRPADVGKTVKVRVTGSLAGYPSVSKTSAATRTVLRGVFASQPTPRVTGTVTTGQTLRVTVGSWSPSARISYQWRVDGRAVPGATELRLQDPDHGPRQADHGDGFGEARRLHDRLEDDRIDDARARAVRPHGDADHQWDDPSRFDSDGQDGGVVTLGFDAALPVVRERDSDPRRD